MSHSAISQTKQRAALLLAEDEKTYEEIAADCGIDRRTLYRWLEKPDFRDMVVVRAEELNASALKYRIAKRRHRIADLDGLQDKLLTVVAERAADAGFRRDAAPGETTGLVLRQHKAVGVGRDQQLVVEFVVDTATVKAIANLQEQAARDLGQWTEHVDVEQRTAVVELLGVDPDVV